MALEIADRTAGDQGVLEIHGRLKRAARRLI
jgi:hypothetical protein